MPRNRIWCTKFMIWCDFKWPTECDLFTLWPGILVWLITFKHLWAKYTHVGTRHKGDDDITAASKDFVWMGRDLIWVSEWDLEYESLIYGTQLGA